MTQNSTGDSLYFVMFFNRIKTAKTAEIALIHSLLILFSMIITFFMVQAAVIFIVFDNRFPDNPQLLTEQEKNQIVDSIYSYVQEKPEAVQKEYIDTVINKNPALLILNNLFWVFCFILPGYFFLHKKLGIGVNNLSDSFSGRFIGLGALAGLTTFFMVSSISLILKLAGIEPQAGDFQKTLFNSLQGNTELFLWSIYTIGLVTGIIEELYFRGYLMNHFIEKGLEKEGLVVSSVLFGMIHYGPGTTLSIPFILTGVGFLFGYSYLKTRNLWVSISAHTVYNSVGLFLTYMSGEKINI